jgi:hypothetical protein
MKYFFQVLLFQLIICNISIAQNGFAVQEIDDAFIPKNGELNKLITQGNCFVQAETSSKTCFVGEPILVTYKFYTRLRAQSKVTRMPTFSGCSVQEMTTNDILPEIETHQGKKFKVSTIRKIQLTPLQAGTIILDTASVESAFPVYDKETTEQQIKTGKAFSHDEILILNSKKIEIPVLELPEANKPSTFNGAIGNFTIGAKFTKSTDTVNENNSLKITITGVGNFVNIICPKVQWPKNLEHFEVSSTEDINKLIFPNVGTKIFELPFTVKEKGLVEIPAIEFAFYDITTRAYKIVQSDSLKLEVKAALEKSINESKISKDITNKKYIWIIPAIALLAGIGFWLKYGKKSMPKVLIESAEKMIEQEIVVQPKSTHFKSKREQIYELNFIQHDDVIFFSSCKKLAQQLIEQETDENKKLALQNLMNQCNAALYAGKKDIDKEQIIQTLYSI